MVRLTYRGDQSRLGFDADVFVDAVSLSGAGALDQARAMPALPLALVGDPAQPTLGFRRRLRIFVRSEYVIIVLAAILVVVVPASISSDRAKRSASAPAVLEQVWVQSNGRAVIGRFSFAVDGVTYRGRDVDQPYPTKGDRTWSTSETIGMHVCYDPARPGEEFALTPARYRCGDPDIITTDGGW